LYLSFETVRGYRKDLYIKLNAHNIRELINKAEALGLV
jgi:DNA-binding CsgD family transcriptional regulator